MARPRYRTYREHYVVDGTPYATARCAYGEAVNRGWTGSFETIASRLHRGYSTWARLLQPVDQTRADIARNTAKRKHAEMAAVIAALDARKNRSV